MSIVIDILIILIFIAVVAFFTKYGLDRAILKIGNAWLSLALTFLIGPWVTGLLEDLFLREVIVGGVYNSLTDLIAHNANGYNLAELFEKLPANFVAFLDGLGASLPALEAEFGAYTEASSEIIQAMAERIATPCVSVISSLVGHVLGFIVPWLFFRWLKYEIQKDNAHTFFRVFDHIGGFVVGVAGGYFIVLALAVLTKTVFQVIIAFDASVELMPIYHNSFVFRFLGEFDTFGAIKRAIEAIANAVASIAA